MLILPATPEIIASFVVAAEASPDELSTIANVMPAPPMPLVPDEHHGRLVVMAKLVHAGPTEARERALAPVRACRVRKSMRHAARVYSWISPPSRSRRWS
jgi:hypothetical protein